jgi:class 3 adenylate cyclase/YHS domain-containing protein
MAHGHEPQVERTFQFADMAGFTALTEAMGDEQALEISEGFFTVARELLADAGANEVKTIGDALMLEIPDAANAVKLGVTLATEVGVRHGFPTVRVGMHTGPALRRDDDWFGATVNLAARVSGAATGGQALLTSATRDAAGPIAGVAIGAHGRRELRHVADPVELFHAVPVGADLDANALPIDPVCRMAVNPDDAAGTLRHGGRIFYFCSMRCVQAFAAAPGGYSASLEEPVRRRRRCS